MQSSIFSILLGCILCGFHSTHADANGSTSTHPRVLIMGDSLSAAYNISIEQSWPVLFQQKLKIVKPQSQVFNASISGETSEGGLERLDNLITQHKPTHMILELGGNDGLRGYKFKQTQQNLSTMINLALNKNIRVLLIGVRLPPNLGAVYNQRFQQIFEQINEQLSVVYLAKFLQGIAASDARYMQQDGIHPTAVAQPMLANRVFELFQSSYLE